MTSVDDAVSSNPLRAVVEVIARALVDNPDAVRVTETERRGMAVLELTTAPGDMGKIIGRQGRTAAAFRTLVALTAEKHGKRAQLDIGTDGGQLDVQGVAHGRLGWTWSWSGGSRDRTVCTAT